MRKSQTRDEQIQDTNKILYNNQEGRYEERLYEGEKGNKCSENNMRLYNTMKTRADKAMSNICR